MVFRNLSRDANLSPVVDRGCRVKRTDTEVCLGALRRARETLSKYIDPLNPFDAVQALDGLIDLLDSEEVDAALNRIDARSHFRVMEFKYPGEAFPLPLIELKEDNASG